MRSPLAWLDEPSPDRGVSFLGFDDVWRLHTFDELAASVEAMAVEIAELAAGRRERDRFVGIVLSTGPEFVAAFFGALRAGCTPCPLAPPAYLQRRTAYTDHLAAILAMSRPVAVVTEPGHAELVAAAARQTGLEIPFVSGDARAGGRAGAPVPDLGLLQFTSGSTGRPRGVRVTMDNLAVNIAQIHDWAEFAPGGVIASWLPVHHDMGLIGTLLSPIVTGYDVRVMRPEQFVEQPLRWVRCFHDGSTHTATPSFGFGYAAKRLQPSDLAGLDLSGWKVAIAGAERLDAAAMARFARLAAPAGFSPRVFQPAYGMAEATLAITGVPTDEVATVFKLDWSGLRVGEHVPVVERARIDDLERIGDGDGWALDCGAPLPGLSVTVVGDDGVELLDGSLGELVVRGPTVAGGYLSDGRAGSSAFADGAIRTGDAGLYVDGRLVVMGRIADCLSLRGRNVYAEDLEATLATIEGVSRGRCAVFTGMEARSPAIVAVVEAPEGPWAARVGRRLAREARDDAAVYVLSAGRGTIARTSSGKPRRRAMFTEFLDGTMAAEVVWTHGVGPAAASGRFTRAATVAAAPSDL